MGAKPPVYRFLLANCVSECLEVSFSAKYFRTVFYTKVCTYAELVSGAGCAFRNVPPVMIDVLARAARFVLLSFFFTIESY
jgi:hypothetical protein